MVVAASCYGAALTTIEGVKAPNVFILVWNLSKLAQIRVNKVTVEKKMINVLEVKSNWTAVDKKSPCSWNVLANKSGIKLPKQNALRNQKQTGCCIMSKRCFTKGFMKEDFLFAFHLNCIDCCVTIKVKRTEKHQTWLILASFSTSQKPAIFRLFISTLQSEGIFCHFGWGFISVFLHWDLSYTQKVPKRVLIVRKVHKNVLKWSYLILGCRNFFLNSSSAADTYLLLIRLGIYCMHGHICWTYSPRFLSFRPRCRIEML